jgi:uncharacterized protein YecT (DUF1311 family)
MQIQRAAVLFAMVLCLGQGKPDTSAAEKVSPDSTLGMVMALDVKIKAADAKLNEAYQKVLGRLDETGKKKIKEAERAWIVFRDAQCEAEADEARGGTLAQILGQRCRLRMIEARTAELEAMRPLLGE